VVGKAVGSSHISPLLEGAGEVCSSFQGFAKAQKCFDINECRPLNGSLCHAAAFCDVLTLPRGLQSSKKVSEHLLQSGFTSTAYVQAEYTKIF